MSPRTQRWIGIALAIVVAAAVFAGTAVFARADPAVSSHVDQALRDA